MCRTIPVLHCCGLLAAVLTSLLLPEFSSGALKGTKPAAVSVPRAVPVIEEEPPPAQGPNILFIILDDLNDWCGPLGGHPQARTPNLDRLARRGMTFTNAHCAYALCNPSRTALLTGVNPWNSGVWGNEQDWRHSVQLIGRPTLPEHLRAGGYFTAASGKIFHASHGGPEGRLTGWHGGRRGFELSHAWHDRFPEPGVQMPDLPVHTGQNFNGLGIWHWDWGAIDKNEDEMDDAQVAAWAAQFLQRKLARPFFLAVGFYHPHAPWYAPKKYFDLFPLDQIKLPEVKADDLNDVPEAAKGYLKGENYHQQVIGKNLWKQAVQAYLANIAFADAMVGRVLDALERSPHQDRTVVALTSDHGWHLGQKQHWHKGGLWEEATRVPLIISAPGVTRPAAKSAQPVSLVDLYPTFVELAGLPKPEHFDGESLVTLLRDPAKKRLRPVVTAMGGEDRSSYAVRNERWRYIRYHDGSEELYDHNRDPHEWANIAAEPENRELIHVLAASLTEQWRSAHRPMARVTIESGADGSQSLLLIAGDRFDAKSSPDITGRSFEVEADFIYHPVVDRDATIISQGGPQLGWAVHLIDGRPAFTVNYEGLRATLKTDDALPEGHITLRGLLGADGTLGINATGLPGGARGFTPMEHGFPRQPEQGLRVGESFEPLEAKVFPNSSPFDGFISRVRFTMLPALKNDE